jgi:hypothetical protein
MNPTPKERSPVQPFDASCAGDRRDEPACRPSFASLTARFACYAVALEMIRSLREIVQRIRARNASHTAQIERAAPSVALNLSEGRRRTGRV